MEQRKKKEKIGISISPNLKREAEEIMEREDIPTMSDFISQAVIVYIDRYKREQREKYFGTRDDPYSKNDNSNDLNEKPGRLVRMQ